MTVNEFLNLIKNQSISEIEMFDFIQNTTRNFEVDRVVILLSDIELYYHEWIDEVNEESQLIHYKNSWEIPTKKIEIRHLSSEVTDFKTMRNKTHLGFDFYILKIIYLLKSKLKIHQVKETVINELPAELKTDKAKEIFSRAIAAGFISESEISYVWKGQKNELAYFAELMSKYLNLSHGDKNNSFKPFEITFGINGLCRVANDYKKIGKVPARHKMLDALFEM